MRPREPLPYPRTTPTRISPVPLLLWRPLTKNMVTCKLFVWPGVLMNLGHRAQCRISSIPPLLWRPLNKNKVTWIISVWPGFLKNLGHRSD